VKLVCWKIIFFLVCYLEILNLSIISFICNNLFFSSIRELIVLFLFKWALSCGINHNSIRLLFSTWYQELPILGVLFLQSPSHRRVYIPTTPTDFVCVLFIPHTCSQALFINSCTTCTVHLKANIILLLPVLFGCGC
jgi:hypothetical protein